MKHTHTLPLWKFKTLALMHAKFEFDYQKNNFGIIKDPTDGAILFYSILNDQKAGEDQCINVLNFICKPGTYHNKRSIPTQHEGVFSEAFVIQRINLRQWFLDDLMMK